MRNLSQPSWRQICFIRFRVHTHLYFFTFRTEFSNRVFFVATDETGWAADTIATEAFVGFDELRTHGAEILWVRRSAVASFTVVVALVTAIIRTDGEMVRGRFVTFIIQR